MRLGATAIGFVPAGRRLAMVALAALLLALPRLAPKPPLAAAAPSSRSVLAADGQLLRLTLASDEQYRLWTPLADIAAPLQDAVLLYEDRAYYWHPGVNPWALARAAYSSAAGQRRIGGSTITMQLARRLYGIDSRSVGGKLAQIGAALWLNWRYDKRDILEAYLNYAPYGGNIEGVGAASLIYLRKPAARLSVPEALTLAVIPQNPAKRIGEKDDQTQLKAARNRLAALWLAAHPEDARYVQDAAGPLPLEARATLPFHAPHAVEHLLRMNRERVLRSSIDLRLQGVVERVLGEYLKTRADVGINNAAALLVDASTMQVKALVGSADYRNADIAGQVNGVIARRSPGSTLKPFIYALALDQGLIHPATILKDAPQSFGAFAPENFDGRFVGPIAAQDALIRSRNVPAVDLAARLAKPSLYQFLQLAGVQKLESEAHYGLALVLGGAEVTMEELAQLYAMLANRGQWRELSYTAAMSADKPAPTLLSAEAAFITLDMLRHTPRPDTYAAARPSIAWKTGTSWGFRDAWTAGVFGRYVLVIWIGNFDGASNPALIGIEAAAPLFLRLTDALRAEQLDPGEIAYAQPPDLRRVEICSASGDLPNAVCPATRATWFIAGKSPIRESTLHRAVLIDMRSGRIACRPGPHTQRQVFEYWPTDMQQLFRRAGMPLRTPPDGECGDAASGDAAPRIITPLRAVVHVMRIGRAEPLLLRADAASTGQTLHWFADAAPIGIVRPGETLYWKPPQAGRYQLRVVDAAGRADNREVVIELEQ
jgi:penicillin-binding protein 1C